MSAPRVLVIAHGHPDFSIGGGEIAAYAQYLELRRRGIDAMFLARSSLSPQHTGTSFSLRSADGREVLFSPPPADHFRHSQPHRRVVYEEFRDLLRRFAPTVVHFHHYVHLGLEMLREARHSLPQARLVLTLHEFLAQCHANGQMLKANGLLCTKAAPLDCNQCFPNVSAQEFFMRELFIKSFLNLCDRFVCPSKFLRDRYVEWGLPAPKMSVVENGQPLRATAAAVQAPAALQTRFVLLGQLSRFKGTPVLLEAVRLLPQRLRDLLTIEIHGTIQFEVEEFKAQFQRALIGLENTVRFGGAYRSADVHDIVQRSGWVIVPSIWWENSPLVIQEAFAAGRPILCSNIGGMAEKVTHGVDGLHFRVGSAGDLAACIETAATTPGLWQRLQAGITAPPAIDATVDQLLALYDAEAAAPPRPRESLA
jgi:glycosyltransferase involved in cell wall biosynthesis